MPYDTPTKKAEWRRRDYERRMLKADPQHFERLEQQKQQRQARRDAAASPRLRLCKCGRAFAPGTSGRAYCSRLCLSREWWKKGRPRASAYPLPWTHEVFCRMTDQLRQHLDPRSQLGTWEYKVCVLARGLRLIRKQVRRVRAVVVPRSWDEALAKAASSINQKWSIGKPRSLLRPGRKTGWELKRYWSERCNSIAKSLRTRAMGNGTNSNVKPRDLLGLLGRQQYRCALTGDELTPENTTADHKIPVSRGGSHELDNIALVTAKANAAKGTMTTEEFVALCRRVASYHDGLKKEAKGAR